MKTKQIASVAFLAAMGGCGHGPPRGAQPIAVPAARAAPPASPDAELQAAIAELRGGASGASTNGAQTLAKKAALDRAWSVLKADPARAIPRVERARDALSSRAERDDFFRIEAAGVLWEMAGVEVAPAVARALDGVDPHVRFETYFLTLASAAVTRDDRVLPILWHALATDEKSGGMYVPAHALTIGWPITLDFMLASYGPALCDRLPVSPAPPADPRVARSLIYVASALACTNALPTFRKWAGGAQSDTRGRAVLAVSQWGAPEDRGWLDALARSPDAATRRLAATGLRLHGDPASGPTLRKLLADPDPGVRLEAMTGVFHLIDAAGGRAVMARRSDPRTPPDEAQRIDKLIQQLALDVGEDPTALKDGGARAWQSAIAKCWKQRDARFALDGGERRLSHDALVTALDQWERRERLPADDADETSWINKRQVLSVATPADLPKLISVRAHILHRQSDEALDEVRIVDGIARVLRRRAVHAAKPND